MFEGADVNARDPQGQRWALMLAAMSNSMTGTRMQPEFREREIERGLSVHGSKGPSANSEYGVYTPLGSLAKNRDKVMLAAVLKEFGASE